MPVIPPIQPGPSVRELEIQRLNTRAFISANPILVMLIPRTRRKDGNGVSFQDGSPRPAQVGRLIDQGVVGAGAASEVAGDGVQRKQEYQLLLPHDGVVGIYDYWVGSDGIRFEVKNVSPANGYEVRAGVVRYGEKGLQES